MNFVLELVPHSAAVHMPVALALLMPGLFAAAWWTVGRRVFSHKLWFGLTALAIVQVGALVLSLITGERAEFMSAAPVNLLEQHEHAAEALTAVWAVAALGFAFISLKPKAGAGFYVLMAVLLAAQMAVAVHTGHLGGQLMK